MSVGCLGLAGEGVGLQGAAQGRKWAFSAGLGVGLAPHAARKLDDDIQSFLAVFLSGGCLFADVGDGCKLGLLVYIWQWLGLEIVSFCSPVPRGSGLPC